MTSPTLKLRIPNRVAKTLKTLHPQLKKKIRDGLEMVLLNPYLGKNLRDELEGLKTFRVGKFRIIYKFADPKILEIISIGPRKTIYAETYRYVSQEN